MTKKRRNWIFCLVVGLGCILLGFLPSGPALSGTTPAPRAQVRVLSVNNDQLSPLGIAYSGAQSCEVEVLEGEYKGTKITAVNHLNSALDKDKLFEAGDRGLAALYAKDGTLQAVTLIDHYRLGMQGLLFALFGVLLIAFAGFSGLGALISLVASVMVVWKLLIPWMLVGYSPILGALLVVTLLTVMIDLLVAGLSRISLVAILGSLLGTGVTCLLSMLFGSLLKLDGSNLPYVVPLIAQQHMQINLRDIFFAMVFIANSGALMDLSMDIASACEEVRQHRPDIGCKALMLSGFSVGRNVIGTMTTTLMLAYSGSYLSLLMYFAGQGTPIIDIVNLKYVASEVLITLVGSFGLVTVAPFTAVASSVLLRREAPASRCTRHNTEA